MTIFWTSSAILSHDKVVFDSTNSLDLTSGALCKLRYNSEWGNAAKLDSCFAVFICLHAYPWLHGEIICCYWFHNAKIQYECTFLSVFFKNLLFPLGYLCIMSKRIAVWLGIHVIFFSLVFKDWISVNSLERKEYCAHMIAKHLRHILDGWFEE